MLILPFFPPHTQVYARTQPRTAGPSDSLPLRADLQYSHISLVSPLCPLFSLSLFAGSLALPGVIGVRGYRGLPALRGACFAALMSFTWLPVCAGPEPHRPALPEKKMRGDPFSKKQTECLTLQKKILFIFFNMVLNFH